MTEVRHHSSVKGSRAAAFAYVNDYRNVPEFMFGVSEFRPITEQTSGLGSQFVTVLKVGPKTLESTVECTEWVENELIKMESIKGFGADTEWRFADGDEPGVVEIDAVFAYTLPGGVGGRVLGGLLSQFVTPAVKHSESVIRKHLAAEG
ncbi:SRPBCC family protein [Gordonia sp. HY442]|uniref:SRPBCC family protein n=1 Tax=Gordonia zhenghanii TaxID=2911516 RepID=UPI001F284140|nr:SRPBCC family protein [Gordonia zhenghanii]MCF8607987.1 SRPBCC family protein [Gordonia zhenghanii]